MIHKGLSGFGIKHETVHGKKFIKKWTRGPQAVLSLGFSHQKQNEAMINRPLWPIHAVPVHDDYLEGGSFVYGIGSQLAGFLADGDKDPKFSFRMPFIDYPSGFTVTGYHRITMQMKINESFRHRCGNVAEGFKSIVRAKLIPVPDSDFKTVVLGKLSFCPDFYPYGYAHGDFGFANMFIGGDDIMYITDFTESFIYSPLMDLVTMELSLFSDMCKPFHKEIYRSAKRENFYQFREQADILRMVKVLQYGIHAAEGERKKELTRMFYGVDFRSSNL